LSSIGALSVGEHNRSGHLQRTSSVARDRTNDGHSRGDLLADDITLELGIEKAC
jgi:hypothetical protein